MTYTRDNLIVIMRDSVGDNSTDTEGLFLQGSEWGEIIDSSLENLSSYVRKEDTAEVSGTGESEYTIPAAALNTDWDSVWIRLTGATTHTKDRQIDNYDTFSDKIYMPVSVNTGEKVIFWIKRAYDISVDDLPRKALEIMMKLAQIRYIESAFFRRADYVKWASLNKSAASINQLTVIKEVLERDLAKLAVALGDGTNVHNLSRYK